MTECAVPEKNRKGTDRLTITILIVMALAALIGAYLSLTISDFGKLFLPGDVTYTAGGAIYEVVYVLLTIVTDVLYLLGGAVIAFGSAFVTYRFISCKLKDASKPSCVTRFLSGYLTLSLELFIGAEIIKTVVVRTSDEFLLLILVIFSRGLFSLILYLERRWHGPELETE